MMAKYIRMVIAIMCGLPGPLLLAEEPRSLAAKSPKEQLIAESHDELGRLVAKAIDTEDYLALKDLMAPVSILQQMGAPEQAQKAYSDYVAQIPSLAKRFRAMLDADKLLPLSGKPLRENGDRGAKNVNGKMIKYSSGIRIVNSAGDIVLEFVDRAIAVDGRWYVIQLCTESVEKKLGDASSNLEKPK